MIGRGVSFSCLADEQVLPCGLDDFASDCAEIIDVEDALDLGKQALEGYSQDTGKSRT